MGNHDPLIKCAKPTVFRSYRVSVDKTDYERTSIPVKEETDYINGLSVDVRVVSRLGFEYIIPPSPGVRGRGFVVRTVRKRSQRVRVDTSRLDVSKADEKVIDDSLTQTKIDFRGQLATDPVSTEIMRDDFVSNGGTVYLHNHDIVVSVNPEENLIHPHSRQAMLDGFMETLPNIPAQSVSGYLVRIIDNHRRFGTKFINLNGRVLRVPAEMVPNFDDGVYVIMVGLSNGDFGSTPAIVDVLSFEEAKEKIGLYDSVDEARALGDRAKAIDEGYKAERQRLLNDELVYKTKLKDAEKNLKDMEMAWDKEKLLHEQEKRRSEEEIARRKQEQDRLQHELNMVSIRRKDFYEERSLERKDTSEMMKWVPALILAVVGLIVGLRK